MFQGKFQNRISSERGMSRLMFILIILASVLALIALGVPFYHYIVDRSDAYGCGSALATANDQLKIDYLSVNSNPTAKDAKEVVTYAMDGWDDLCPGGGDCYIVEIENDGEKDNFPYKVVCALHDKDVGEAAQLNAKSALEQIMARLADPDPAAEGVLTVTLNSEKYSVAEDPTETVLRPTHKELKKAGGALISYNVSEEDGSVVWFCYADKNRICIWDAVKSASGGTEYGWTVRYA